MTSLSNDDQSNDDQSTTLTYDTTALPGRIRAALAGGGVGTAVDAFDTIWVGPGVLGIVFVVGLPGIGAAGDVLGMALM